MISPFYLLVDRDFIIDELLSSKKTIYNFTDEDKRIAEIEIEHKGFYSYNKNMSIWKIWFYENDAIAFISPIMNVISRL